MKNLKLKKNKKILFLIAILVLLVFIYILKVKYGLDSFEKILNVDLKYLITAFFLYYLTYIFRAFRFFLIIELDFLALFQATSYQTFLNNLIPFRLGELSFPLFLKKYYNFDFGKSTYWLVIMRFFDLFSLFMLGTLFYFKAYRSLLLLVFSIFIVVAYFVSNKFFGNVKFSSLLYAYLTTFGVWFVKFVSYFFLWKALGKNFSLYNSFATTLGGELSSVLPIHSLGGFGTYESGMLISRSILSSVNINLLDATFFHTYIFTFSFFVFLITFLFRNIDCCGS